MTRISIALLAALAVVIAAVSFLVLAPLPALVSCFLGWTMLAIAVIDARHFIVPDVLSLPAIPAGLIAAPPCVRCFAPTVLAHVAGVRLGSRRTVFERGE